ncbi:SAM-dependent methyltransferase [Aurantiacibacter poecillastricola]|uniref:SAM-dependent methyltransferase n=1 Tax=Aurantiacibacter poecillastricola TaxID=3064385 RepID=UPI0027401550|nr:class I SAM-dependent methyltransferase [Aurantiacibacter sp. 219JJ12-13]MDP5261357.1 class I SAM-dependent methyltransferase [Aurantiacibacter sp. 219JJ12-13]
MIKSLLKRFKSDSPLPPLKLDQKKPEPTLWAPVSQACTQGQMEEPHYSYWCGQIRETPRMHRKQWEFCYILQVLSVHGMLCEGRSALGFGVGMEPLAALFADRGVSVLATDLEPEEAMGKGWVLTDQHAASKQGLNDRDICDPEEFDKLVDFRFMDMNRIDSDLAGKFDFVWSACAFEHLGSIMQGLVFVINSVKCLKPGGIAVHTTEFNCSSNLETLDNASTVLFRQRDFLWLQERLAEMNCEMEFNFNLGRQPLDRYIDSPPYSADEHLKLQIMQWSCTSFGLVVRKRADA